MDLSKLLTENGLINAQFILWAFYFAIILGVIFYYITTSRISKIIDDLLKAGATTPETAVSPADINLDSGFLTKLCLNSPSHYKNMLVAITEDGKYYANYTYSDTPPVFKMLRAITRKKKSRIDSESEEQGDIDVLDQNRVVTEQNEAIISAEPLAEEAVTENVQENDTASTENVAQDDFPTENTEQRPPERVKFDPYTAKYYIPAEVHDKIKNIYKRQKMSPWLVVLLLIGLGIVVYFAGFAVDMLIDSFSGIFK